MGEGWAKWVMDSKEDICGWVLFVCDESLISTPETNITLYAN